MQSRQSFRASSHQSSCVSSLMDDGCLSPLVEVTVSEIASNVDAGGQTKAKCLLSDASGTIYLVAWGSSATKLKGRLQNGEIYRISGCSVSSKMSSDFTASVLFGQGKPRLLQLEWNSKTNVIGPIDQHSRDKSDKNKRGKFLSKMNLFSNRKNYNKRSPINQDMKADLNDSDESARNPNNLRDVVADRLAIEGNLLYHTQLYQDALDKYLEARDLAPDVSRYHAHAASCHLIMGQPNQALCFAVTAAALDPSSAFAWSMQAEACLLLGKVGKASEACEETKTRQNGAGMCRNVDSNVKRMKTLDNDFKWAHAREDFSAAVKYLDEALTIATHSLPLKIARADCLLERGKQSFRLNKYEEAAADFEEVLGEDEDNVECKRLLEATKGKLEIQKRRKQSFSIMGLDENANVTQVKKAFRNLCKVLHPDKLIGKTSDEIKEGEIKFKQMKGAFDIIMESQSR